MKSYWSLLSVAFLALFIRLTQIPTKEPKCTLDYTANMTAEENIRFFGYPYEKHRVQTEDGYLLSLTRLPRKNSDKLPVLAVHGFMSCSRTWIAMGPDASLGYRLFDEGYDVWLADLRGSPNSIQHSFLEKNDSRFWDFSFDEMGRYDHPAIIDYILKETGHKKLVHAGISMGSTVFFVMTSLRPEYNAKVAAHIALGPVVLTKHSTTYWNFFNYALVVIENVVAVLGAYSQELVPEALLRACNFNFLIRNGCVQLMGSFLGPSDSLRNESIQRVVLHTLWTGASTKTGKHLLQLHDQSGGQFRRFDYKDKEWNVRQYGQEVPPDYDLSKTTVPLYIFCGETDVFSPEQDLVALKRSVKGPANLILVDEPLFNHGDFIVSEAAKKSLIPIVLDKIGRINKNHRSKTLL